MYVLPKGLESLWIVATGKVGLKRWRGGESLLTAIGMAMVMVCFFLNFLMESLSSNWNCHPSVTEHLSKRPSASFRIGSKDTISVYRTKLSNDLYEWRTPPFYPPLSMRPLLVLCLKLFTSSVPEMNRELRYLERRMTGWQNNCNVTLHVDRVSGGSKKKTDLGSRHDTENGRTRISFPVSNLHSIDLTSATFNDLLPCCFSDSPRSRVLTCVIS